MSRLLTAGVSAMVSDNHHQECSTQNLTSAVAAVRAGTLSLRKASRLYGVPYSTIRGHTSGRAKTFKVGKPLALPMDVEDRMVSKVKEAAEKGFGLSQMTLACKVSQVARQVGKSDSFTRGMPGEKWIRGFRRRHPDLSLRVPTPLCSDRARMMSVSVAAKYFDGLEGLLSGHDLKDKPFQIWNMDETSVPLTHKPVKVLAETGARNIPGRVGNSRDNITFLACVNAAGGEIPPFIVVRGKTSASLNAYNVAEGLPGAVYVAQEKAWMEDVLGEKWFKEHFLRYCGPQRPQILILDSHHSHESLGLIQAARENGIELLALPPHTTQWLCPLDKAVFGPFSRAYNKVCSAFMARHPSHQVCKWEWPKLFAQAHDEAIIPKNIKSGFAKCGIFPFDSHAIPPTAYAPSTPFVDSPPPAATAPANLSQISSFHDTPEPQSAATPFDLHQNSTARCSSLAEGGTDSVSQNSFLNTETASVSQNLSVPREPDSAFYLSPSKSFKCQNSSTFVSSFQIMSCLKGGQVELNEDVDGTITIKLLNCPIPDLPISETRSISESRSGANAVYPSCGISTTTTSPRHTTVCRDTTEASSPPFSLSGISTHCPSEQHPGNCTPVNNSPQPGCSFWEGAVDDIFTVKKSKVIKKTSSRKLSGHRLLTSGDIIREKQLAVQKKRKLEEEKNNRKLEREKRKQEKLAEKNKKDHRNKCLVCNQESLHDSIVPTGLSSQSITSDVVQWIQCDDCKSWLHQACIPNGFLNYLNSVLNSDNPYLCPNCLQN